MVLAGKVALLPISVIKEIVGIHKNILMKIMQMSSLWLMVPKEKCISGNTIRY
ncbi:hypothetical protein DJ55_4157 [Yersinia pseudotuberculosis]|nr:hypothetical protein DJ55_4157 [Yersinia pseudotuberculosis]